MPGLLWFPFPSTSCPYRSAPPESGSWWTFLWPPQETHAGADDYWQIPQFHPTGQFHRDLLSTDRELLGRLSIDGKIWINQWNPLRQAAIPGIPFPHPLWNIMSFMSFCLRIRGPSLGCLRTSLSSVSHRHQKSQKRLDMGWIWLWRATCSQHGWEPEKIGSDHLLHYYSQSKVK